MKAGLALLLIVGFLFLASRMPDGPAFCQSDQGWVPSFKVSFIATAIAIFLLGGMKRTSNSRMMLDLMGGAALIFALWYFKILNPFGNCL